MTREQWAKLTPEEQRIKVAELCGWEVRKSGAAILSGIICWNSELDKSRPPEDDGIRFDVPDYLNDLNAIHEAEKSLDDTQSVNYDYYLKCICWDDGVRTNTRIGAHLATAAQRAEAFVLTMEAA